MSEMLAGHGFYLLSAYGMAALAIAVELVALRRRRQAAQRALDDNHEHRSA